MPLGGRADQRVRESSSYVRLGHEMRQSETQTLLALTLGSNLFSRPVTKEPVCAQRSESGFPPHV